MNKGHRILILNLIITLALMLSYTIGASNIEPKINSLIFSIPINDVETTSSHYYLGGASDSSMPLFLNEETVQNRTKNGYFGIFVPLSYGINVFTILQGELSITRTITRREIKKEKTPKRIKSIDPASAFPDKKEIRLEGEKITLSCIAPDRASIRVELDNKIYKLIPESNEQKYDNAILYSLEIELPETGDGIYERDLGRPEYIMILDSYIESIKASGNIIIVSDESPYLAVAVDPIADLYDKPEKSGITDIKYYEGMTDSLTGMRGDYIRLSSGFWVRKNSFNLFHNVTPIKAKLENIFFSSYIKEYRIFFKTIGSGSAYLIFNDNILRIYLSNITIDEDIRSILPEPLYFDNNSFSLYLPKKDILGYYIETTKNGLTIVVRKSKNPNAGDLPLEGYVILLDPGHGGHDSGATGLSGKKFTEKTINLNTSFALKRSLENLGATVKMTRSRDVFVSLSERVKLFKTIMPDLFISIHADHLGDTNDNSSIEGFSVYYHTHISKELSETILNTVVDDLGRNNRGIKKRNFQVIRGTWAPSVLIEIGFIANPSEYEWMMDEKSQEALIQSLTRSIIAYLHKSNTN